MKKKAFDCINSSPEAFEFYLSCMNGMKGLEALEILCGEEEEEEEEEEECDDIDALIEQLEMIVPLKLELVMWNIRND